MLLKLLKEPSLMTIGVTLPAVLSPTPLLERSAMAFQSVRGHDWRPLPVVLWNLHIEKGDISVTCKTSNTSA